MDSVVQQIPVVGQARDMLPAWAWVFVGWTLFTFLLKPYTDAIVRLYQPKMDKAVRTTPSILRRIGIEFLRINLIYVRLFGILQFLLTPKSMRFRTLRKNEIVYYVWLFSREFPRWDYYKRVKSWFEHTVYLDDRTSLFHPEPLKGDDSYMNTALELDQQISHAEFVSGMRQKRLDPIVRVGVALVQMDPGHWMGRSRYAFQMAFGIFQSVGFFSGLVIAFWSTSTGVVLTISSIILFVLDRRVLTMLVLAKAMKNPEFYSEAIRKRAIQLHE